MAAVPTVYNHVQFRSRLEATWAAFFDLCGWVWTYEPFDLDGYIPDFVLHFKLTTIVEVKPFGHEEEFADAKSKIVKSGWVGPVLLVGYGLILTEWGDDGIGWLNQPPSDFTVAQFAHCHGCDGCTVIHEEGSFACPVCGFHDGDSGFSFWKAGQRFAQAKNTVQWKSPCR